ncbi:MAG: DEAD/DEAH box helicase [Planctomycetota bacterium]|nr:DEAD/DEAH box helicase [Planctomycetota bacterium]
MNEVATATWTNYLDLLGSGLDEPCPYHVVVLESSDPVWLTVDLECETIGTGTTEINRSDFVPELVKKLHETLKVSRNRLRPSLWRKRLVDYFARRFFGVPAVRSSKNSRQWELLSRTVAGIDALGIMPTGSGKSLSFQLPSILLPGAVLVICPLRSLMRDQVHNLRDFGINAADFISSDVAAPQRARIMDDFFSGRLQLLYISPERIQIKSFLQELRNESSRLNISCVAIDEAHCVSEWGHDFRPSYLQIPRFVTETLRTNNECPPILAVTATASPPVEADVRTIHHFENNDNVIKASSLDRRGISLSIHPSSPKSSKLETLGATLSNVIPSVLNTTFQKMVGHAESYDAGGIIFSVYANPHSTSTYRDGVGAIYDYLTSTEKLVDPELCRLHSSTVPQKCPRCGHYSYYNQKGARQQGIPEHYCSMCNEEFGDPATTDQKEWDSRLRESQDRFKRNEFPLMVATKGYGMGIDKRNIRYILHHGFSSSLEAYYQEAGRAGRDDQHSHCAIVTLPLHPDCERDYFDSHNPEKADYPGCLKGQDFTNWTCPHGLSELCDFGKQARFLKRNYPEVTTVLDRIMELWDELVAGETSPVKLRHGNTDNEKNAS